MKFRGRSSVLEYPVNSWKVRWFDSPRPHFLETRKAVPGENPGSPPFWPRSSVLEHQVFNLRVGRSTRSEVSGKVAQLVEHVDSSLKLDEDGSDVQLIPFPRMT